MSKMYFLPFRPAFDSAGITVPGSQHYFTLAGTNTPSAPFTDAALTSPHANPVIANGIGYLDPIYLDPAISYRVRIYDADAEVGVAVPLEEYDPYVPALANSELLSDLADTTGAALIGTDAGVTVQDYIDNPGSIGPITASFAAPAFTNVAYYSSIQWLTNGATPGSWYSTAFAGNNATEALTSGVVVPVTATNLQTNAFASYIRSDRAKVGNGGDVAGFFFATCNATNGNVFPLNTVANDTAGKTGQTMGIELDYNVNAADTLVNGINLVIVGNTALSGFRNALTMQGVFHPESQWSNGVVTGDGSIESYAIFIGSQTSTTLTNRDSQKFALVSYKNDNTRYIATGLGDHLGGIVFRPGAATGSFTIQDPTGATNWFSVSVSGFGYPTGMGGAVTQGTSRTTAVTLNKVCGAITLFSAAGSATFATFTVNNSMVAANDTIRLTQQSGTTDIYHLIAKAGAGSFTINFATTGGTTTEQPVINFTIIKGANS
jgi:hypothetical protein